MSVYAFLKKLYCRIGSGMMPKMGEIFGKVTSAKLKSNFSGPAGGSALERALPPRPSIWLVGTEIVPVLEEQYFIAQAPGQIAARMLGVKSENHFTKMKISRDPVDGFC